MTTINGATSSSAVHPGTEQPNTSAPVDPGSPVIPSPHLGFNDPVAAALAAVTKFAKEARDLSRELQKTQRAMQAAAERQQVAAMRDQADEIRDGALVGGISLGVSAALSGAAFVSSMTSPSPSVMEAEKARNVSSAADQAATHAAYTTLFEASSKSVAGYGEIAEQGARGRALLCEADAVEAESRAKNASSKAEIFGDNAAQAEEIARKAADAIRAVADARHAAQMAIASLRG